MTYHSETQERSACRKLTKITKSLGLSSNVLFRYHICSFKHDIYRCSTVALDSNDRDATLLVSPLSVCSNPYEPVRAPAWTLLLPIVSGNKRTEFHLRGH